MGSDDPPSVLGLLKLLGEATVEAFHYLVGTTHYDDGLHYVPTKVFVGSFPVDPVVLAERTPVLANGLVT